MSGHLEGLWTVSCSCKLVTPGYLLSLIQIMLQYNVPDYRNSLEFLTMLAKKRGYLQKGGVPNTEQAATAFLDEWTG